MQIDLTENLYPTNFEIQQKVEMIKAYIASPYYADSIFADLKPFVSMVTEQQERLQSIHNQLENSTLDESATQNLRIESVRIKRRLLTCFQYFETAHQVYLRGTYADFSTDHQYGMSYLGNIRTILNAINFSIRKCFSSLNFTWSGFCTLSNCLSYLTAEASIIVMPFFAKNTAEFINDWLILTHEMGHVYFWDFLKSEDRVPPYHFESWQHRLLDEILADIFCLEQGYSLDVLHMIWDFERIRKRYQDIHSIPFFRTTYNIRKFAAVLYCCARVDSGFANLLYSARDDKMIDDSVIIDLARRGIEKIVDITFEHSNSKIGKENLKHFIEHYIVHDGLKAIKGWYESEKRVYSYKKTGEVEEIFLRVIADMATAKYPGLSKIHVRSENIPLKAYNTLIEKVVNGEIVYDKIDYPFLFIKELIDYCDSKDISLDSEERAHVRVAAILSLNNQALMVSRR